MRLFNKKKALIIGSAPEINISDIDINEYDIMCVNGSSERSEILDYPINTELLDASFLVSEDEGRVLPRINMRYRASKYIIRQSNLIDYNRYRTLYQKTLGYNIKYYNKIHSDILQALVLKDFGIIKSMEYHVSSGIWLLIHTVLSRYTEIFITGISFLQSKYEHYPPHFYKKEYSLIDDLTARNHSRADIYAISRMRRLGIDIKSSDIAIIPFINNWQERSYGEYSNVRMLLTILRNSLF